MGCRRDYVDIMIAIPHAAADLLQRQVVRDGPQHRSRHSMPMTYESMMTFADSWIAAWNRRDVEAVLAHFAEDAQFVSPIARNFVGVRCFETRKSLRTTGARRSIEFRFWNSSSITRPGMRS